MSNTRFASGDAIRFGWESFKKHAGFLIGAIVVVGLILGLLYIPQAWALSESSTGLYILFYIIYLIAAWVLSIGAVRIMLDIHDGKQPEFSDLFTHWNLLGKYIAVSILGGIVTMIGFFLLIVPGIIASIGLSLAMYYVIDKGMGPIDALKASWEDTKGVKLDLLGFFILIWLINMAGAFALGVGMLVTLPLSGLAMVYVYRHLSGGSAAPQMATAAPATPAAPEQNMTEPPAQA